MALTKIDDRGLKTPIDLLDNEKIRLGTGNDLELYHDGTDSLVKNATGDLILQSTGDDVFIKAEDDVFIKVKGGTETAIECHNDGEVELYYDHVKKFETTSAGVKLSGNLAINNSTQSKIVLDTSDGSDSKWLSINGGGDASQTRGGGITFWGNEATNNQGKLSLNAGNSGSSNGTIAFSTGGALRASLTHDGHFTLPNDSSKLKLGASNDLQIYHDGSHNILLGVNGADFKIKDADHNSAIFDTSEGVYLYYDNVQKFQTKSDGVDITGELQCDSLDVDGAAEFTGADVTFYGASTNAYWDQSTNRFTFEDNTIAAFGCGQDLAIYHDGSNSYLGNATGDIIIENSGGNTSNQIYIRGKTGENSISVHGNGQVELYYDDSKKFETLTNGTKVTGQQFITEGTINLEKSGAHHHRILSNDAGNDLAFQQSSDTGANTNFTTYLRIADGGAISLPQDSQQLRIGADNDIQLYHISGVNYWKNQGSTVFKMVDTGGDTQIECNNNGATKLYHNGTWKLETKSDGVDISGTCTATAFSGAGILPSGGIIIWSGASNAIPTGFVICDGNNSTPDLRDRFVIGAGNNYAVAATGGSKDAVVVAHDHDVKVGTAGGSGGGFVSDRESEAVGGGTDTASIQSTGVSGTDKNLPPYYALCYIMKT